MMVISYHSGIVVTCCVDHLRARPCGVDKCNIINGGGDETGRARIYRLRTRFAAVFATKIRILCGPKPKSTCILGPILRLYVNVISKL